MLIFVTGATGLVGRRLVVDRLARGDRVVVLSRDRECAERLFAAPANPNVAVVEGDPGFPGDWQHAIDGCDAVVHLAGAGVADRRWSAKYRKVIADSRVNGTHQVVSAILDASRRPSVLISASAIGYYGDTGTVPTDESAPAGRDFLARVCVRWEEQTDPAEAAGVRVVRLRIGMVLDRRGGALAKMIPPFRAFVGGPFGTGRQYVSWIHWRDLIGLVDLALTDDRARGAVNATSPNPVTNRKLSRTLGRLLHRPSLMPVPGFALRLVAGEFARYLTMSQRIAPAAADDLGYGWVHPSLEPALAAAIDEKSPSGATVSSAEPPAVTVPATPAPIDESIAPSAPVRLLAIDIDGTLLRSDSRIAQGDIQACRAAEKAGCVIVLATARTPRAMRPIVRTMGLVSPTINYHGAVIWNPIDDCAQYHEPLAAETARAVVEAARGIDENVLVSLEVLDKWYTDRPVHRATTNEDDMVPDLVGPLDDVLQSPVTRIDMHGESAAVTEIAAMIRERFWASQQAALFVTDPNSIQVAHRLADKSIALQRIAQRLGVTRDQVMAVGDGANDLGMLEWAGFGVAVANAVAAVKNMADVVVPANDDLGVARAVQRFVLMQSPATDDEP